MPLSNNSFLILSLVSKYGGILSAKAILDLKTGLCKGFGFAMYENIEQAQRAMEELNSQGFLVTFAVAGPKEGSVRLFSKMSRHYKK